MVFGIMSYTILISTLWGLCVTLYRSTILTLVGCLGQYDPDRLAERALRYRGALRVKRVKNEFPIKILTGCGRKNMRHCYYIYLWNIRVSCVSVNVYIPELCEVIDKKNKNLPKNKTKWCNVLCLDVEWLKMRIEMKEKHNFALFFAAPCSVKYSMRQEKSFFFQL